MYKKTFLKRFLVYPAFIGFIVIKLLEAIAGFEIGALFVELGPISFLQNELGFFSIPYSYLELFYAYAVGYAYGSISILFSIRKMKLGLVSLVFFYIKMIACMFVFSSISMLLIPLELSLVCIVTGVKKLNSGMERRETKLEEYLKQANVAS